MDQELPRRRGRQRRPRVPDSLRKRAARACLPCRQHKEKCQGGLPCARCQQYKRTCRFESIQPPAPGPSERASLPSENEMSNREHQMERIIQHFMGDVSFTSRNLQEIADMLEKERDDSISQDAEFSDGQAMSESYSLEPLSTSMMHYSGELSHWNFSKAIRRRLQNIGNGREQPDGPETTKGFFRATGLQSSNSFVTSSMMYFPPRDVAEFLTDTFLQFAQTNYFYFDETTFRQKMNFYYTTNQPFTIEDTGWICTLLMTFAIGTQFAYMQTRPTQAKTPSSEEIPDDHIGLELYRFSCRLIPDMITIASVETVQAFLLLGVYTLPIDTSGLAYTYYGLAIKMAVQNGMHRKYSGVSLDPLSVELRNRLWWSAYSLESRISILHGRPVSVSRVDTDADMPTEVTGLRPSNGVSNLPNIIANIYLTNQLSKLARVILRLRRCPRIQQTQHLQELRTIRTELCDWWASLPVEIHCRDLNPSGPLFRCNVHLELTYTTATIYIGRPFLFLHPGPSARMSTGDIRSETAKLLSDDCVQACLRIIDLCQLLQNSVGLARVSYTEFSSCRAALLALIAQRLIDDSSERLCSAIARGMTLIRQICVGLESARSEVAVIEALERARLQLDRRGESEQNCAPSDSGYDQFRRWAQLWRGEPLTSISLPGLEPENIEVPGTMGDDIPSFDGFLSSFPQELNAFASIPASDEFELPTEWPL
ncbi:hypothetical protein P170DRAFT_440362 [Aspergillus steynii IBT 23096]|uniref:Zn(2)-C6 fungal-type domain-containing protein n=1 Tax=Aspergillus steynii IBT 23096 TaxID=1392250 RepID=A0A2I2FX38_9EURO|nr:uncharacterized protein P170DRAFT_440362 [Aspergillus steynii IBT 23096]PLB45215.1 hypothetical protein P170DRAFT_440362 [Aspergillus steynii IBT 23096]